MATGAGPEVEACGSNGAPEDLGVPDRDFREACGKAILSSLNGEARSRGGKSGWKREEPGDSASCGAGDPDGIGDLMVRSPTCS